MAVDRHAIARRRRESGGIYSDSFEIVVERRDQAALLVVGNGRHMHDGDVRRIARGIFRRQLVVARPGGDIDLQLDVRVFRLEFIEQPRDDLAFTVGIAQGRLAHGHIGPAFAEDALDRDMGVGVLGCARGQGETRQEYSHLLHLTAAPDTALTMYFWKMT